MDLDKEISILLVDDDIDLLKVFSFLLKNKGYVVEVASSGSEAIKKLDESKFDLLILDIKLPDMLGDEIVRKLREKDNETAIIMITGYPNLQDSINTLDFGIEEILLKPISSEELLRVAEAALN